MAGAVSSGQAWADGDQVTSTKLAAQFTGSAMTSDAITGTTLAVTGGKLKVNVITATEIGTAAVTTAKIADAAVTADKIAAAVAGDGLAGGAGTALSVGVDDTTIEISTDKLQIKDASVAYAKVDVATQAEMEAASSAGIVAPDVVTYAPGAAKAYGKFTTTTPPVETGLYNVTDVTRLTTNSYRVNLSITMADANYAIMLTPNFTTTTFLPTITAQTTTSFTLYAADQAFSTGVHFVIFGTIAT